MGVLDLLVLTETPFFLQNVEPRCKPPYRQPHRSVGCWHNRTDPQPGPPTVGVTIWLLKTRVGKSNHPYMTLRFSFLAIDLKQIYTFFMSKKFCW